MTKSPIFRLEAPAYRDAGFWPRPIRLGSKACYVKDWGRSDSEIPPAELEGWLDICGWDGLGLLMGSPFPDGTALGAFDIDHDHYVALGGALLRAPVCGRVGSKGAVFFVRVRGKVGNPQFCVRGAGGKRYGKVAECLFSRKLCVLPPTVHPNTGRPYEWLGQPLLETDFRQLPIVEA
jgi:hypothetical protein